jgi:hypothetical protein
MHVERARKRLGPLGTQLDTVGFDCRNRRLSNPGSFGELANTTGLNRETLYRTLSENGNPRLSSLGLIIEALGLRLSIESSEDGPRAA